MCFISVGVCSGYVVSVCSVCFMSVGVCSGYAVRLGLMCVL